MASKKTEDNRVFRIRAFYGNRIRNKIKWIERKKELFDSFKDFKKAKRRYMKAHDKRQVHSSFPTRVLCEEFIGGQWVPLEDTETTEENSG